MVAFSSLEPGNQIAVTFNGVGRLVFRLKEEAVWTIDEGGTQHRIMLGRSDDYTPSMLICNEQPGNKAQLSFAWGVAQSPKEKGELGKMLTFANLGDPCKASTDPVLKLSANGHKLVQRFYIMPSSGTTLLAERLTPACGARSSHYFQIQALTESDIQLV